LTGHLFLLPEEQKEHFFEELQSGSAEVSCLRRKLKNRGKDKQVSTIERCSDTLNKLLCFQKKLTCFFLS